jgi:hypothetical protein
MTLRIPAWACRQFKSHGYDQICAACLKRFQQQGNQTRGWDLPPRVEFDRGWFSVGATHWFGATDETSFPSRDGSRLLAQAVCGGICETTIAYAPLAGRECKKCLATLKKLGFDLRAPGLPDAKHRRIH